MAYGALAAPAIALIYDATVAAILGVIATSAIASPGLEYQRQRA